MRLYFAKVVVFGCAGDLEVELLSRARFRAGYWLLSERRLVRVSSQLRNPRTAESLDAKLQKDSISNVPRVCGCLARLSHFRAGLLAPSARLSL